MGSDIEHNKFCGQVSTMMRRISNIDGDLLSQFENINENDVPILKSFADLSVQIRDTPHQKFSINNQTDANKSKIKRFFYFEVFFFGFCKSFKKGTKKLGFHLTLKTNDLQHIIHTSMGDDINITIFIPNLIPAIETELMFNEATQNKN